MASGETKQSWSKAAKMMSSLRGSGNGVTESNTGQLAQLTGGKKALFQVHTGVAMIACSC